MVIMDLNQEAFEYSSDEEMMELVHRDATATIVGYVIKITAPAPAGRKNEHLFKFVLSNGNKQIWILIWGTTLIDKYYQDVVCNRVMNIDGAYCKAATLSEYQEQNNFVPFEIIIKEYTEISFVGYHQFGNAVMQNVQTVSFDSIHNVQGLIQIQGFIKTKFALIKNGLMSYGVGAITDGSKKITVQIKQFLECSMGKGVSVTVTGTVKGSGSLVTVFCDSIKDIKLNPDIPPLTPEQIQRGNRPVKRFHLKETNVKLNPDIPPLTPEQIQRGNRPVKRSYLKETNV